MQFVSTSFVCNVCNFPFHVPILYCGLISYNTNDPILLPLPISSSVLFRLVGVRSRNLELPSTLEVALLHHRGCNLPHLH